MNLPQALKKISRLQQDINQLKKEKEELRSALQYNTMPVWALGDNCDGIKETFLGFLYELMSDDTPKPTKEKASKYISRMEKMI